VLEKKYYDEDGESLRKVDRNSIDGDVSENEEE